MCSTDKTSIYKPFPTNVWLVLIYLVAGDTLYMDSEGIVMSMSSLSLSRASTLSMKNSQA
jgi:hypothetical protein